ncbi:MAG: O-antigen ligase family protein [Phycisphaerae bacterium]
MRFAFYVTLLVACVPVILTRPFFGLCIYYVVSLMQPKVLCWQPDFQDSMIVGVPLVFSALGVGVRRVEIEPNVNPVTGRVVGFHRAWARTPLIEQSLLLVLLALLLAYIGLTRYAGAFPAELTTADFSRLLKMSLVTALLTGLASDARRFRVLYVVVALSVGFWAIKGGLNVFLIGPHRVYGRNYDNNFFALTSAMVLPMVFNFGLSLKRARLRGLFLVFSVLICVGIIGSQSRAGFVAMLVVLAAMAWTSRHRFKALTGVALLAIVAGVVLGPEIRDRVDSIVHYEQDRSARSRFVTWDTAFALLSRNPVIGVGFANYERAAQKLSESRKAAHNIWLSTLAELGLAGYPLYVMLLIGTMLLAFRVMRFGRRGPPELRWSYYCARGLLLGLLAYAIHGFFHNEEFLDLTFAMIGMVIALRATVSREIRAERLIRAARSNPLAPAASVFERLTAPAS